MTFSNASVPDFVSYYLAPVNSAANQLITSSNPVVPAHIFDWKIRFLVTAIFASTLARLYHVRNNSPLKDVPGPWFASCSILYRFYYGIITRSWHTKLVKLHQKYGTIVRIAPDEVSISDPRAVSEIYAYGYDGYPKSEMYDTGLPNGFFNIAVERDIVRHAVGRRVIAKDYNMASVLANEAHFDNMIQKFIAAIDKNFASTGTVCDFTVWSEYFTYDMITDLLYGKAFGFCKTASDVGGGLRNAKHMLHMTTFVSYMPWIWGLIQNKHVRVLGEYIYTASTRREIAKRLGEGNTGGRRDLLQGLFEARYPDGSPLPLEEITNHAYMFTCAASDPTAVTLCKIIINLVQNPAVHGTLLAQLLDANLSETPTWKELSEVPFLAAVVKETLRLHPPAGFTLPRTVPAGGRTLCGKYLPEGTTVGMSAWCVHANEEFWGADTLHFKPERWLDIASAQKLEAYGMTFGQGARGCIGKPIALVQLIKATAQLVLNFDFAIEEQSKIRNVFIFLVIVDGLRIRFGRREGGPLA